LTKTPFVYDIQDGAHGKRVAWFRRGTLGLARFLSRLALRRADVVIGENPDAVAALSQRGRGARACIIPNLPALTGNVPAPSLNLARARHKAARGDARPPPTVVTCVGARDHFRGLALFFNAIPYVLRENADVRFVVAGGTEGQIARMREALGEAGVTAAVTFTGCLSQTDLAALLMVSDMVVAPCCTGPSMPIRVLDYLYLSKPIVMVDTGFSKVMFSGHNAMVVDAEHEALAKGILNLCQYPKFASELAQKGHETLLVQHRTPEAFREALRQCYAYGMARERE